MIIRPYVYTDLLNINLQQAQISMSNLIANDDYAKSLEGNSFSGVVDNNVIACGGIMDIWQGRGVAWMLLSSNISKWFLKIDRAIRVQIAQSDLQRLEAYCYCDHLEGKRWLELLGFQQEGIMKKFTPDGKDHYLYARVK